MEGYAGELQSASMRPGQAAPVFQEAGVSPRLTEPASMRPGQAAPVFQPRGWTPAIRRRRFNEAGAGCPGIQAHLVPKKSDAT